MLVEPYNLKKKIYFCGKSLKYFEQDKTCVYNIFVVDVNNCCYAKVYSDNEIDVLFEERSLVPNKQPNGGQSALRFQRIRQNMINEWFKDISDKLLHIDGDIILGINHAYEKPFMEKQHTYVRQKIKKILPCEYSDSTGIYDMINRIEKDKNG